MKPEMLIELTETEDDIWYDDVFKASPMRFFVCRKITTKEVKFIGIRLKKDAGYMIVYPEFLSGPYIDFEDQEFCYIDMQQIVYKTRRVFITGKK